MKMRVETSRLLVTFFVMAAFLFGQAAALEHAAEHGGAVHAIADHMDHAGEGDGPDDGHDDGLCDLSLYGAGLTAAPVDGVALCVPASFTQTAFAPVSIALLGGVSTTGPPARGPPHLS